MSNALDFRCPNHSEKYVDFCIRTKWHETYAEDHKKILKLQRSEEGVIYCFNDRQLNTKQRRFLNTPIMQQMSYEIVMTDSLLKDRCIYYFCYMTDEVKKEFDLVDLVARNKLFDETKFDKFMPKKIYYQHEFNTHLNLFYLTEYGDQKSRWYGIKIALCNFDENRQNLINKLLILGFAFTKNSYTYLYATEDQMIKFTTYITDDKSEEKLQNQMLDELRIK